MDIQTHKLYRKPISLYEGVFEYHCVQWGAIESKRLRTIDLNKSLILSIFM